MNFANLTVAEIARRLEMASVRPDCMHSADFSIPPGMLQGDTSPAAVLMPLVMIEDAWNLLYIRRTEDNSAHSGQVAFPGGRMEPVDRSPYEAALREAEEEIGLAPADVKVLGRLHEFLTISNYCVTPIVGVMPWPYPLRTQPQEVKRCFTIPLSWLADPTNRREEQRVLPHPYSPISVIFFQPYNGEILWGASARFTLTLLEILK
ncbi:MAG: CoA pyrophosphatase [Anaerolineales bacterium]|nr:CoA pyrophosphatase [Anaerolineales bacterium]